MQVEKSKLSQHKFKKGKFITPMKNAFGDTLVLSSWGLDRLPEFLWIALIVEQYERTKGLEKVNLIFKKLQELNKEITLPAFSQILNMENSLQEEFFKYIIKLTNKDILTPLSLLYSYSEYPVFAKAFCNPKTPMKHRQEVLNKALERSTPTQSDFATDIRFLVIYFLFSKGKMNFSENMQHRLKVFSEYPYINHDDEKMRSYRAFIRSSEVMVSNMMENDNNFLEKFWEKISIMSDCKLFSMKWTEETVITDEYICFLENIFAYLSDLFIATNPLDKKMLVLLGIATYSYKRVREISDFKMFNSITARGTVRVLVENYIMMKYLIQQEAKKNNIWAEFQEYGIGAYKGVVARSRDFKKDYKNSHIDPTYLEILVNHHINEEFIDVDTSYFDKQNIREKADIVNEKPIN